MTTFSDANQARLSLKMKLSQFGWYNSSTVVTNGGDYIVIIGVKQLDNNIRKEIPPLVNGIDIKTELE